MNVVITIGVREAIPVRAIAWATYSILSPDVLAEDLAKHSESPDHHPPRLNNATAYHLIGNSEVRAMAPREWDSIVSDLSMLHSDLKDMDLPRLEGRRQWKLRATEILPRGTFLWRDEFEAAYQRGYRTRHIRDEREGDRGYTCNPIVPECLEPTILEGFERFLQQPAAESAAPVVEPPQADPETVERDLDPRHRKTLLRIIAALLEQAKVTADLPDKTTAHALNACLDRLGVKRMKPDTIADVIKAARALIADDQKSSAR